MLAGRLAGARSGKACLPPSRAGVWALAWGEGGAPHPGAHCAARRAFLGLRRSRAPCGLQLRWGRSLEYFLRLPPRPAPPRAMPSMSPRQAEAAAHALRPLPISRLA